MKKEYKIKVRAKLLNKIIKLPESLRNSELEITVKPYKRRIFKSLSKVKIDTRKFKFDRELANER